MSQKTKFYIALFLILIGAVSRILSFETGFFNLAPVAALGLFAGAVVPNKSHAFLLAIASQLIGDIYIALFTSWPGFYGVSQFAVYIGLVLATMLGYLLKNTHHPLKWIGGSIGASTVFFIISNLGVWLSIQWGGEDLFGYGTGWTGIVATYVAAIPFFQKSLVGDMIGTMCLFSMYQLVRYYVAKQLKPVSVGS